MAVDKRLKNVQQADLTESRVNDDFVYWLKTWGSNILIVLLLIAAAGMGWQWWQQRKEQARDDAWAELSGTALPEALIEVAQKHQGNDSVSIFAELSAADRYSDAILRGKRFDREATAADAAMTPELREEWLKEADRLYAHVVDATANPKNMGSRMFNVSALFGRAALAEDRGDLKAAEGYLQQVSAMVKGTDQEALAGVAAKRIATLGELSTNIVFPPRPMSATPGAGTSPTLTPVDAPPTLLQDPANPNATGPLIKTADGGFTQKIPGATLKLTPTPPPPGAVPSQPTNPNAAPSTTPPAAPAPAPATGPGAPPATPPANAKDLTSPKKPAAAPAAPPSTQPATPPSTPPAAPKQP